MQIGYFFDGLKYKEGEMPCICVAVRPLEWTQGPAPSISLSIPALQGAATIQEFVDAALEQAQALIPESAFATWVQMYREWGLDPLSRSHMQPVDWSVLLKKATLPPAC